ncbi:MAG: hypothetical protein HYY37_03485 [Candidatus Aenigmarchaeota archaeon]|nr:hypothetical protein [Candidatus Aenigmarchaeota archaeon]
MHATRIFIVLALALLALPVHAEINVSLLYGWNQTHWTPVRVTTAGALMTDLNLTESIGINPKSDNTYNLGAASLRWASVYGVNGYFADSFGIGTVAPRRKLQINGSAGVSLETNESAYLAIGENQKVGIGLNMTSPLGTVHINSSNALGALRIENTTGTQLLFVNGSSGNVGIGTATLDTDA